MLKGLGLLGLSGTLRSSDVLHSAPNHVESDSHASGRSPLDSPKLRMPEDSQQKYVLKAMAARGSFHV